MAKLVLADNSEYEIIYPTPIGKVGINTTINEIPSLLGSFTEENLKTVSIKTDEGEILSTYKDLILVNIILPNSKGIAYFCFKQTIETIAAQTAEELAAAKNTINTLNNTVATLQQQNTIYQDGYNAARVLLGEE